MKGTIETANGKVPVDSGNPWKHMEEWGGNSWFPSHEKEEATETVTHERAERTADIEPS
jgi:hypothetical protein